MRPQTAMPSLDGLREREERFKHDLEHWGEPSSSAPSSSSSYSGLGLGGEHRDLPDGERKYGWQEAKQMLDPESDEPGLLTERMELKHEQNGYENGTGEPDESELLSGMLSRQASNDGISDAIAHLDNPGEVITGSDHSVSSLTLSLLICRPIKRYKIPDIR